MDVRTRTELDRLVARRIDPRKGVGHLVGASRAIAMPASIAGYFIAVLMAQAFPLWWMDVIVSLALIAPVTVLTVCWLIPYGSRKRAARRCKQHHNFLCPWCRYGLTGLEDEGDCPECGNRYARSVCEQLYTNAYRPYQPAPDVFAKSEREAWSAAIRLRDQGNGSVSSS